MTENSQPNRKTFRRLTENPLLLLAAALLAFAITALLVRKDLTLTRVSGNSPKGYEFRASQVNPLHARILEKLARTDWLYSTSSYDTSAASAALRSLRTDLSADLQNANQHLKIWDFLDEAYIAGPDALPTMALVAFSKSVYATEPINQAGLCDYLADRTLPALFQLIKRRDYAAARIIVLGANAWIDTLKPNPTLASEYPRLQGQINLFRRLDALLNDMALLYNNQDAAAKLFEYIQGGKEPPRGVLNYLIQSDKTELSALGHYFLGAALLRALNYGGAAEAFRSSSTKTLNPKLSDLANLGYARAVFWASIAEEISRESALQQLARVRLSGSRYAEDVRYYSTQLRTKPKSTEEPQ